MRSISYPGLIMARADTGLNLIVEGIFLIVWAARHSQISGARWIDRSSSYRFPTCIWTGLGRLLATIETLNAAIRERMADFADIPDRILLITGDLVDDPTPPALDEALAVIASFRQTGLFTDIQAIAGNHDVKRPSQRAGRHDVYDYLHLPRTSKSVYYRQAGLDLVLLDSNRASLTTLASGNVDQSAYNAMVSDSARLSVELAGSLGRAAAPIMPSRRKTSCACWRCTIIHCRRRPEKESGFSACPTNR